LAAAQSRQRANCTVSSGALAASGGESIHGKRSGTSTNTSADVLTGHITWASKSTAAAEWGELSITNKILAAESMADIFIKHLPAGVLTPGLTLYPRSSDTGLGRSEL
jgi:hypothetical protein